MLHLKLIDLHGILLKALGDESIAVPCGGTFLSPREEPQPRDARGGGGSGGWRRVRGGKARRAHASGCGRVKMHVQNEVNTFFSLMLSRCTKPLCLSCSRDSVWRCVVTHCGTPKVIIALIKRTGLEYDVNRNALSLVP